MKQKIMVVKTSVYSGQVNSIEIYADPEDVERWQKGKVIQSALPYLTPQEREFMITGMTEEEWKEWCAEYPEDDIEIQQTKEGKE